MPDTPAQLRVVGFPSRVTRVARLLAWPAVGVALCGFVWLTKVQARGWTPRTKLEVVLLALAAIVMTTYEIRYMFAIKAWERRLPELLPVVLPKMGWQSFEEIAVVFGPGAHDFVVRTAGGVVEILCTIKNDIALCAVAAPRDVAIGQVSPKRWFAFPRDDLLYEIEKRESAPLKWRHDLSTSGYTLPVAVRAPSVELGVDYVATLARAHMPEIFLESGRPEIEPSDDADAAGSSP